jgi:tRNA(fMet)-specific endonuclease VapC
LLSAIGVFKPKNHIVISIVSAAEIRSFAYRNRWGILRLNALNSFLNSVTAISIDNQNLVDSYMEIDAFSQGKHHVHTLPIGMSARNMGKNDVWIAATTHVAKATLITTDADFEHLDAIFFKVEKIKI